MTPAYLLTQVEKDFSFGDQTTRVLKGLTLEIARGEYAAIMGPSGSGKSTLMNLMGALDVPTGGSVQILGKETRSLSDEALSDLRRDNLGFIFQSFNLLPAYSVLANASLPMTYANRADSEERARRLLDMVGMSHRLTHMPPTLSGGEKQRVAIARSLANDPDILLADEPTGALDQKNGEIIMDILDQLNQQGKTIIMVTHDPNVAKRAGRVIEMLDGVLSGDHPGGHLG